MKYLILLFAVALGVSESSAQQDSMALSNSAVGFAATGDCKKAIELADQAIVADPKNSSAYNTKALCIKETSGCEKAVAEWDKAVELDPNDGTHRMQRGDCRIQLGNIVGAQEDFELGVQHKDKYCRKLLDRTSGKFSCDLSTKKVKLER